MNHFRSKCMQLVVDMFKDGWERAVLEPLLPFVFIFAPALLVASTAKAQMFIYQRTLNDPNPAAFDNFGSSVAISGDNIIIGTPRDDTNGDNAGQAFLFHASTGNLLQTFNHPNPDYGDWFGESVAISGNKVLIGARNDDINFVAGIGQVFLFDASTGNLLQTFNHPNPDWGWAWFGDSVAISGDNVLIGASRRQPGQAFLFDASTGNLLQTFNDPNPAAGDWFGESVTITGDKVVIGARFKNTTVEEGGQAFLFDASTGNLLQTFDHPNPIAGARFGTSVAISADKVLIGAPVTGNIVSASGQAFLFDTSTGNLLHTFNNPNPARNDHFGDSVAITGDNVVIGASDDYTNGLDAGTAFLFDTSTGDLLQSFNGPIRAWARFGASVAISGDNVMVGAPVHRSDSGEGGGQAFLFSLSEIAVVPNVIGLPQDDAVWSLTMAGLMAGTITFQTSNTVASGNIISQGVEPGREVNSGRAVDLIVSNGSTLDNNQRVYWTDDGSILRANMNGLNQVAVLTGLIDPENIAIDSIGGKMYWLEANGARIQRANLDGTGVETVVTGSFDEDQGIALDVADGKIYWTDNGHTIWRANLDGTGQEIVLTGLSGADALAIDRAGGKLYWLGENSGLKRANLDGTEVEIVVAGSFDEDQGIALDVANGKIYWTDNGHTIWHGNLDGTDTTPFLTGLVGTESLAIDRAGGKLYWLEGDGPIKRVNLDGTGVESLVSGPVEEGGGIALDLVLNVEVPDVAGLTLADAEAAIAADGLMVGTVTTQSSNTVDAGNVISQNPTAGSQVSAGTAVDLVFSSGPPPGTVNNGDTNGDDKITPADALLAFQHFLAINDLDANQQIRADVNQDGSITPADALCIFRKFLALPSCLD